MGIEKAGRRGLRSGPMPADVKNDPASVASRPTLQGLVVTRDDERALLGALEQAFDYRGDVTIEDVSGRVITGYLFDRSTGATLAESRVRVMLAEGGAKVAVSYSDIRRLEFSGRDMAHGKTFESWIARYIEAKRKGAAASIESEALD